MTRRLSVFAALLFLGLLLLSQHRRTTEAAFPGADNVAIVGQVCLPAGRVEIIVSWVGYNQGPQWVDLSLSNNGFGPGSFIGLQAGRNDLIWDGLLPGMAHYLRVNTFTNIGWVSSSTVSFITRSDRPSAGAFPGARDLSLTAQTCNPDGRVGIAIAWTPALQITQWVDLTLSNNNFQPGTFIGAGPFLGSQGSLLWEGLLPGRVHFLRVNTLTGSGWFPSQTLMFLTRSDCTGGFGIQPVSIAGNASQQGILTDVRVGAHPAEGFDRIVFEFENSVPNAVVRYQANVAQCGSGMPVILPGEATLTVRFEPAVAHNEQGNSTIDSNVVAGTGVAILQARATCDFEGVVAWAIGTATQAGFRVTTLSSPPRLVIDVQR